MTSKTPIIEALEKEQMNKEIPDFSPGDTIVVKVKVKEGNRERLQAFEGVVLGKRNRQLNSSFTVRKISNGIGVERTFQTYSPLVDRLSQRRGAVRRAALLSARAFWKIRESKKSWKAISKRRPRVAFFMVFL